MIIGFAKILGVEGVAGNMDVDMNGISKAEGFDGIKKKVKELMREGYSASQILSQAS